mmetsp:Transcript_9580/g.21945  ORF Transcript_9580/g.21945 Transcript_9580/m.21945 type:complete len:375 (+) Transcript_9580:85-1209(+)
MRLPYWPGVLIRILVVIHAASAVSLLEERRGKVGLAANMSNSMASGDGTIPEWRLAMFDDKPTMPPHGGPPLEIQGLPGFTSTKGQDEGRCPLLKLPLELNLITKNSGWMRQTGSWTGLADVTFATWKQEFLSRNWRTMYVSSTMDGHQSFQATVSNDEELKFLYDWEAPNGGNASVTDVPLLDCDRRLAFVVRIEDKWDAPVSILSSDGRLLAITYADPLSEKLQFADPVTNYRIATAEAPGIGANLSRDQLVRDPSKGGILPYGVSFAKPGYANASRFLEEEYRWVIVAAVQVKALVDTERNLADPLAARVVPPVELVLFISSLIVAGVVVFFLFVVYQMTSIDDMNRVAQIAVSAGDVMAQKLDKHLVLKQ